jgi:hypothetical protein
MKANYNSLNSFLMFAVLLPLGLFSTSCIQNQSPVEEEEDLRIILTEYNVGHQYVELKSENIIGYSLGGTTETHYDTAFPFTVTKDSIETMLSYYNYPFIIDLVPNTTYWFKSFYHDIESDTLKITTLSVDQSCTPTEKTVSGDRTANIPPFSNLVVASDRLIATMEGDFKSGLVYFSEQWAADIKPGVYTTVNDLEKNNFDRNVHNTVLSFTTWGDTIYVAKTNQGVTIEPVQFTNRLTAKFCDLVFINDYGDEITLSGYLK